MASIYKQPKSKFWWIKFRYPADGLVKRKSTKLRFDSADTRRAKQLEAEYTYKESQIISATPNERWVNWVEDYLNSRCGPNKYHRYKTAWRTLRMFLQEKDIQSPRQLRREHCFEYMTWRSKPNVSQGKYRAGHNTALLEIKVLCILMDEAVERKYAPFNPCLRLRIKRTEGKQKPELNDKAIKKILTSIPSEPEPRRTFLMNSFLIARYHGCRISETYLNPMDNVSIRPGSAVITFRQKGNRIHAVNLHPKLIPLFTQLRADKKTETYPKPKSPSKDWFNFLTRIGVKASLAGACFHSLRVTAATTFARKGVPEKKAMSYLGHASTTIHRSYVRLRPDDLSDCTDALA